MKILLVFLLVLFSFNSVNADGEEQNKFNNLLFYYGYPTHIGEGKYYFNSDRDIQDAKRIELVTPIFSKFEKIVWAGDLAFKDHEEYSNTIEIIDLIKNQTESYGYVPIYEGGNYGIQDILNHVDNWIEMGVDGIFYDEAGFDYFEQSNDNYEDYKVLLKTIYKYAKDKGLKVIFNSWSASDIINNLDLSNEDGVLIESFYYGNGVNKQGYIDNVERYKALKNNTNAEYLCVATGEKGDSQEQINTIASEIKDEMLNVCDYRSVQDHYGSSSSFVYATDDILDQNEENLETTETAKEEENKTKIGGSSSLKNKNIINSKVEERINEFFNKLRKENTKAVFKKKLILLLNTLDKFREKYSDNEVVLVLVDYLEERTNQEYLK